MHNSQALVLAGGFGTRLGDLTKQTPKPVLPVAERPFLEHLLWNLKRHGIERVLISTGYLADVVAQQLGDGTRLGMTLDYLAEDEPLGTGGATLFARDRLDERFFVLNGDTLFDFNYWALPMLGDAAIALRSVPDVSRFGAVRLAGNRVEAFAEKGVSGPGLINAGIYSLEQSHLDRLPAGRSSLERDLFPGLASEGLLCGVPGDGFFLDIGLPETLAEAQERVPIWRRKRVAFLDRDGVLNVNRGYVHTPEECEWVEGAIEAVRWLNERGYLVIVVTNQAGIARGYYDEAAFHAFTDWMQGELHRQGAHLDAVYFCPFHPTEGLWEYRREAECRKPRPGMLLQAMAEWEIEPRGSFMIGDKEHDVEAAEAAGLPGFLFLEGSLRNFVESVAARTDA